MTDGNYGEVTQVIGSVLDARFPEENLPAIYNALRMTVTRSVTGDEEPETLWCEVAQHLGGGRIRAVALDSTDGVQRGAEILDTGSPITVPVGEQTLGRVFNLVGDPIDDRGPIEVTERMPIHREPPEFDELSSKTELFETGIKVMDLLCPLVRGGKAGLFGGSRVRSAPARGRERSSTSSRRNPRRSSRKFCLRRFECASFRPSWMRP